ncbi:Ovule protein [Bacillus velezensis]|nr:hypothetical protein BASU_0512 [Bacillus velezensis UCMB5113]CDG28495.1 hypothetical protein RBAU_0520 [Bacillus velezensis UCMB5033]
MILSVQGCKNAIKKKILVGGSSRKIAQPVSQQNHAWQGKHNFSMDFHSQVRISRQ